MPYLYITQQGAIVRKSGDRFLIEQDGELALDVPSHRLEHILIFGNVQITSQAMAEALDHNIAVSLFSRQGRYRGALTPPPGTNVLLRLAQYRTHQDADAALDIARETVRWKIENSLQVLERYEERDRETDKTLEARRSMEQMQASLDEARTIAELEGREGASVRLYFDGLMTFNRSPFPWSGRIRHPPKDPLNALLSLAYTMVMQELTALAAGIGLDPAIGYLHDVDGARPSLALDLMEPFRAPVADRFVLTLVNRK
jgi:CRISPR-associated protein Cas1